MPMPSLPARFPSTAVFSVILLALTLSGAASGEESKAGVKVTHLANEGFLLEATQGKVLVDALYGSSLDGYPAVATKTRRKLEKASKPFADVDLVLASHFHGDHFDPRAVAEHLRHNPRAHFFSTEQAVAALRRVAPKLADRATGVWPAEGESETFEHRGIRVTAFHLHHGRNRRPPVENLGLLVELGGLTLLHTGDTLVGTDDLEPILPRVRDLDVVFLPFWYFLDADGKEVVDALAPRHRVVMHLPSADAPAGHFGDPGSLPKLRDRIREMDPEAIVLEALSSWQTEIRHF